MGCPVYLSATNPNRLCKDLGFRAFGFNCSFVKGGLLDFKVVSSRVVQQLQEATKYILPNIHAH